MEMAGQYPDRRLGLPVVQADLERLHVVDDRLDLHRRGDRDDRGRRGRLAGRPASDHRPRSSSPAPRRTPASHSPRAGRRTRCCSATILIVIATIINMLGVKLMSRINNFGVLAELIGSKHPDHPAAVPHSPVAGGDLPLLRLRRRPSLGLLRRAAHRRTPERVRDVRVRHRLRGLLARRPTTPCKHAPPAIIRAIAAARDHRWCRDPPSGSSRTRTSLTRTSASSGLPFVIKGAFGKHHRQRLSR